jgi:hypothetical protein
MLKNVSEVTLVTKKIVFLKIFNFVQSFVECKVSLADGIFIFHPGEKHRQRLIPGYLARCVRTDKKDFLMYVSKGSRKFHFGTEVVVPHTAHN